MGSYAQEGPSQPDVVLEPLLSPWTADRLASAAPFRYPEDLLKPRWEACRESLRRDSLAQIQESLNRLYGAKLDSGFPATPRYAALLLREGYRSLDRGETQAARLLGETARNLAPGFAPADLFLSRVAIRDRGTAKLKALSCLSSWCRKRVQDFNWQYRTAGKIFLLLVTALYGMFLFQGPYLLVRYTRLAAHGLRERMRIGPLGFVPVAVLLGVAGVGILLVAGPFWTVFLIGLGLGPYARRWERYLFFLLLAVWALSPWIACQSVRFLSPLPDSAVALKAVNQGEWDAAAESALERALNEDGDSLELIWAASLVAKRRGNYHTAETLLKSALGRHSEEGALWNNLGNLLALRGKTEDSKQAYERAIRCTPDLSASHFNLSQILRRQFSFLKGASEFQVARRLDPIRTEYFVYIHSEHPNRFFMDEGPPRRSLWRHTHASGPRTRELAAELWTLAGARTSLRSTPLWVGLAGLVYAWFVLSGRVRGEVFRCGSCGRVACRRCQPVVAARGMCNPCHQVLYQRDQVPREHRQRQIRKMVRRRERRSRAAVLLNLVLPGLGRAVLQDRAWGAVTFFGFGFSVLILLGWDSPLFPDFVVWAEGRNYLRPVLGLLVLALYAVIQYRSFRKLRERI